MKLIQTQSKAEGVDEYKIDTARDADAVRWMSCSKSRFATPTSPLTSIPGRLRLIDAKPDLT